MTITNDRCIRFFKVAPKRDFMNSNLTNKKYWWTFQCQTYIPFYHFRQYSLIRFVHPLTLYQRTLVSAATSQHHLTKKNEPGIVKYRVQDSQLRNYTEEIFRMQGRH